MTLQQDDASHNAAAPDVAAAAAPGVAAAAAPDVAAAAAADLFGDLLTFQVLLHSPEVQSHCLTCKLLLADTNVWQSGLTAREVTGSESCATISHTDSPVVGPPYVGKLTIC